MLISVIIPMHKELKLINQCVSSVLSNASGDLDFEIVIVNDGQFSLDSIQTAIKSNCGVYIKILMNNFQKGVAGARNTGIDAATGDYIAFLDVDDVWEEGKITKQLSALREGKMFCCTAYELSHNHKVITPPLRLNRYEELYLSGGICTSSVIVCRSLIAKHRFKNIKFGQDIIFWGQILKDNVVSYVGIDTPLVHYNSLGGTKNKLHQLAYYIIILYWARMPLHYSIWALFLYIIRGIRNHFL